MLCILCLTASDQVISIFEEQGINLNISSIIVKHLWLQPNQDDVNLKVICSSCWNALDSFHKFYERVEAAHLNLLNTANAADEDLKEEDASDADNFDSCTDFFADVKVEVKEDSEISLPQDDPLPEVDKKMHSLQALENSKLSADIDSDSDLEIPLATLVQRSKRLSPSVHDDESDCKTNTKKSQSDDPSYGESNYQTTKTKVRKARKTKERKNFQRKVKPEVDENRVKRKVIDPVKKRELSKEFDEVIQKHIKLSCNICHVPLANFFLLRKHYHSVHKERGHATCCGKKFRTRGLLVDHIYLHFNPEYFKCEKCNRVLADRRGLEVHMNTHDTSKERIFQCDECHKSFYRKLLLERHMYTHIPERKFGCEYCDKLFSSGYTLQQHKNNVHSTVYMKICEQCGKSVRGLEAFRRHQLEHSGVPIPLVQCEKCGVKLTTKYGLKRHMDSMHPETKVLHECKVCGKIAPSAAALQRHTSYMHKCERNHKCPMCDKAFKKSGNLRPSAENANDKVICGSCWNELYSFHKFYQKVEDAHSKLISTWSAATGESTDILSTAIRIAGIKQDLDEESDDMDTLSTDDDSDNQEEPGIKKDAGLNARRPPKRDLDQLIHQNIKLACNICKQPMRNFYMLKRHFEMLHNESGYFICCKVKFKNRSSLADHIFSNHNTAYLCDKCDKTMSDCHALSLHKATHLNSMSTINVTSEVTLRIVNNRQMNYQN